MYKHIRAAMMQSRLVVNEALDRAEHMSQASEKLDGRDAARVYQRVNYALRTIAIDVLQAESAMILDMAALLNDQHQLTQALSPKAPKAKRNAS